MNFKKSFALSILFVLLALPSIAFAEGFGVYEWSTGGVAMSENYMFAEEDPAVLAYNPAAITRLDGTYFSVGGTFVDAHNKTKFTTLRGVSDHSNNYCPATIPYTYFVKKTADNSWWGLAIFARYGNQIEYDKLWPGRYDTTYSGIKGMTIQPTYGWKVNSKLSAAVGLDINYMGLVMERGLPTDLLGLPRQDFRLDGTSVRLGGVLSFMYDFTENTSAALVYRTRVKHSMTADIDINGQRYTKGRGSVTLPDSITFGLGHKFNGGKTRVEFDAVWTNWSTYDRLTIAFDKPLMGGLVPVSDSEKAWKASWRLGLGIEHKLSQQWSVLGGYVWDQSPTPDSTMDFTVPTGDRHRFSVGFKYRPSKKGEWTLAYSAILAGDRTVKSHLPSPATGADFLKGELHSGLTQLVSLGYTIKF